MIKYRKTLLVVFIAALFTLFVIKILPLFLPIQYAIKDLPQNTGEYYVLRGEKVTGYKWSIIGNQNGLYAEDSLQERDINLIGNEPIYHFFSDASSGNNRFICYGEIVYDSPKQRPNMGSSAPELAEYVLNVDRWDITYPVDRDLFFAILIPKTYLCRYDFYYDKHYSFFEMIKGVYVWNYKTLPLP